VLAVLFQVSCKYRFDPPEERFVLGDLITEGSESRAHLTFYRLKLGSVHGRGEDTVNGLNTVERSPGTFQRDDGV
jgi:hypothetical protein